MFGCRLTVRLYITKFHIKIYFIIKMGKVSVKQYEDLGYKTITLASQ